MATYAIGDVQGCLQPLQRLLDKLHFEPAADQLWFVGDLINRGPDSLGCMRLVRSLADRAVVVLGNHDLAFLAHHFNAETMPDDLGTLAAADDLPELIEWLLQCPLAHYDATLDTLMVHAGVPPQWDLQQTLVHASELEVVLRGDQRRTFFAAVWGDEPNLWCDSLRGTDRWRYITNALTRMRLCAPSGALEFTHKGPPQQAPEPLLPWYECARAEVLPQVVFGHWAALMGRTHRRQFRGLDTGCVWGKQLSALHLEENQLIQVDARTS